MPALSRSVSRAARPAGTRPAGVPARKAQPRWPGHPRAAEHLEAVLAGVAGPGQEGREARHVAGRPRVVLHRAHVQPGQRGEDPGRGRSLDRDQRDLAGLVRDSCLEPGGPGAQLGQHGGGVRRVRDDHELLLALPVHHQVVEHAAVRRADHRVPGPAGPERRQRPGQRVIQGRAGPGPVSAISPMCDRSNNPAACRTAWCSAVSLP